MFFSLAPQEENICSCTPRDLEEGAAAHSSVPAWRTPGTGEPGGPQSMGSHRVRHDWASERIPGDKDPQFFFLSFFFSSVFLSTLDCCAISFPFPLLSIPGEGNLRKCTIKWLEGRWTKIQAEFERAGALMGWAGGCVEGERVEAVRGSSKDTEQEGGETWRAQARSGG